jgi:hypothetical protein
MSKTAPTLWPKMLVVWVIVLLQMQLGRSMMSDFDGASDGGAAELPYGPTDFASLFEWAPQYVAKMTAHPVGNLMVGNLISSLQQGLQVNTDYSGMGSAEIALHSILEATLPTGGGNVLCWRACDINHSARKCLAANVGASSSSHIFGNIMMRVSKVTRTLLQRAYDDAAEHFKRELADALATAPAVGSITPEHRRAKQAACAETSGARLMVTLHRIMSGVVFNPDGMNWCYKCRQPCRVHGPPGLSNRLRLSAAGTTCTSWSAMGSQTAWTRFCTITGRSFGFNGVVGPHPSSEF